MKAEDKLKQVINYLTSKEGDSDIKFYNTLLKEVLVANMPQPKVGKLNLWDWVYDSEYRPAMCCVWHDHNEKVAIACNTLMLIASMKHYNPDLPVEDGISITGNVHKCSAVNAKGVYLTEGRYPNWEALKTDNMFPMDDMISRDELKQALLVCREFESRVPRKGRRGHTMVRFADNCYVSSTHIKNLLSLPEWEWKRGTIQCDDYASCMYYDHDGIFAICMLCRPGSDYEEYAPRVFVPKSR